MINEEYNKWLILYFDMQSINIQFNCNDIASSLKAQRDKIKQFCIDCLTGVKHQADTNACIFSTPKTRGLLFSYEEYPILEADTTKAVDGKYPLDYATEIIESNLDTIIDYIVQSGTETYNDRTSRGFGNRWSRINDSSYKNSKITVGDITTENVGMLNGKPVIFDPEAAYNEDIIKVSNAKFKNK